MKGGQGCHTTLLTSLESVQLACGPERGGHIGGLGENQSRHARVPKCPAGHTYLCLAPSVAGTSGPTASNSLLVLLGASHLSHPPLHLLESLQDGHPELVICIDIGERQVAGKCPAASGKSQRNRSPHCQG